MIPHLEIGFMHGWGFDHRCWDGWKLSLPFPISYQKLDRGYYGQANLNISFSCKTKLRVFVAHSLGLHLVPKHIFNTVDLLAVISGFQSFHQLNRQRNSRAVRSMKRKLYTEPTTVISDFHRACGLSSYWINLNCINTELLANDLEILDNTFLDLNLLKSIPKIILLHGYSDSIVSFIASKGLHNCLPGSSLLIHPEAEHALPIAQASWCRQILEDAIMHRLKNP